MDVNYFGTLRVIRAFAPVLARNGGGAILNVLSFLSNATLPMAGSYSASKAAALSMTRGVRAELRSQGTLVLGTMPAQIDTDLAKNYPEPKAKPAEVAAESLDALERGLEDVYPGVVAKQALELLRRDPKELERNMAAILPAPR